ncbi:helix-turn-helix transcriptional regulator [Kitasatospora sp. SUK 42]|uniref:ArsR/SmtB family transcription factor n=1 Tax=Kitasatospora sp. SUK 42 TaxID=1588882 RepID=UPI0018CA695F|nr:metalloregulator ArsR/SmtB family transcription factor [Kitasatospora sp. SUK 42]MBV2155264.1 helix-turn-helix domain-containing protein [Kitasatospora sp. SUK 42]
MTETTDEPRDSREISDSRVLASLTHPLRRRVLDLLKVDGPATVGQLAERTGQAPGNVSHHLKVLAESGLIAEAPELARNRREHWWRLADRELSWTRADFDGDPVAEAVAEAAGSILLERQVELVREWAVRRGGYGPEWRDGCSIATQTWLRLTPEEARELAADLHGLIQKWAHRPVPQDGRERETVLAFSHSVPARP